jgi:predicted heme/steroid binding protein
MKEFTEEELARYNGKNQFPAYVAYEGKVYDVSDSFHWKDGNHQVLHNAGADLTTTIQQAPHGDDLLKRFPIVGILQGAHEKE